MLQIRIASEHEFSLVRAFYHDLIDKMENAEYHPAWEKDIYPTSEALYAAIQNREMYLGICENRIVSAMVLNHACNDGYHGVKWKLCADENEVMFIHLLCVLPTFSGRGFAKAMVKYAIETAKANKQKAIRLDVLSGNLPAENLYKNMGFAYIDTVKMFYEDTGRTDFLLYEYVT